MPSVPEPPAVVEPPGPEPTVAEPADVAALLRGAAAITGPSDTPPVGGDPVVAGPVAADVVAVVTACRQTDPDLPITAADETPGEAGATAGSGGPLLLLVDPAADPGATDIQRLAALGERHGAIALVAVRIDEFWDWPAALRRARAVLDPQRRLPVFAVSVAAAEAGETVDSGFVELVAWLRAWRRPPAELARLRARVSGALHALDARLAEAGAAETGSVTVHSGPSGSGPIGSGAVRTGSAAIRSSAALELGARLRTVATAGGRRVDTLRPEQVTGYTAWLSRAIRGATGEVTAAATRRLDQLGAAVLLGSGDRPTDAPAVPTATAPVPRTAPPAPRRGAEEPVLGFVGCSTAAAIGRLLSGPLPPAAAWTLAILTAAVLTVWLIRLRRLTAWRSAMRNWTAETLAEARAVADAAVVAAVAAAEVDLARRLTIRRDDGLPGGPGRRDRTPERSRLAALVAALSQVSRELQPDGH